MSLRIQGGVMQNEKRKILVVEDEPAIADTITYTLETDGMESCWCSTGREALNALAAGDIALMVLDIGLGSPSMATDHGAGRSVWA